MKKISIKSILLFISFIFFLPCMLKGDEIKWVDDINKAKALAKKENKIIMVDVYTEWCGWCKRLDETTYRNKKVIELSKKMINAKINPETSDSAKEFAAKHRVTGFPAIIFIDAQDNEVYYQRGYMDGEPFARLLEVLPNMADEGTFMNEYNKGNYKNSGILIKILIMQAKMKQAEEVLKKTEATKSISKDDIAAAYLKIGLKYARDKNYTTAVNHFKIIDDKYKGSECYFESVYYYVSMLYMTDQKDIANKRIEEILKDKNITAEWVEYFTKLKNKRN